MEFNANTTGAAVNTGADTKGLVLDLSNVETKGFELIPEGTYSAIIEETTLGASKAGNAMITAKYKIVDGAHDGRVLMDWMVLAGNGAEFGQAKLSTLIAAVDVDGAIDMGAVDIASMIDDGFFIGKEVSLKVKIQTNKKGKYAGEKSNSIREIMAKASGGNTDSFVM